MGRTVAVIGGGLGALSGAIRLARMGFEVRLFEQNARLGGKMNERIIGGYRFDTGPSLLTMPFVVDALFDFAGFDRAQLLEFVLMDPLCRYFFPDGAVLDASADREKMVAAIAALSPKDASGYEKFMAYAERIYRLTAEVFLFTPIHELKKLMRAGHLSTLLRLHQIDPFRTVHRSVSRYFSDPRLIQLFDRYATYNGSSPFQAPATLNIIPYVEYGLGGYYIRGGMYRLVDALATVARHLGVDIQTTATVEKIRRDGVRVTGVTVGGEGVDADYVLCGADVVVAHNTLIEGRASLKRRLNRLEPSSSGTVFLWGVGARHAGLCHHNVIFSADYAGEFRHIFRERRAPDDPTVYVAVTSKTDSGHAPPHGENWFVLVNMPYLTGDAGGKAASERVRNVILEKLKRVGCDIADAIEVEASVTPHELCRRYASNRGSIYGISSNSRRAAFRRPPNRSRVMKGLYFAGGSAHPGGGIPLVLLSGKMAAELIAEAEGVL